MRVKKFISVILSFCLALIACVLLVPTAKKAGADTASAEFPAAYSAEAYDGATVMYGATSVEKLSASEAAAANILEGYTDNVLVVEHSDYYTKKGKGVVFDFTSLQIPTANLQSLTFRVYIGPDGLTNNYPRIRIHRITDYADNAVDFYAGDIEGRWADFTLSASGLNFNGAHNFSHLSKDGCLGKFELALRCENDVNFFIDSVSYTLAEEFPCTYTAKAADDVGSYFGSTSVTKLSAAEAAAAGVPTGYDGSVLSVGAGTSGAGVWLDFSAKKIPLSILQSVSFKLYVSDGGEASYPELRIRRSTDGGDWAVRNFLKTDGNVGKWVTVTLYSDGTGFFNDHNFSHLSQDGVHLGAFELGYRANTALDFYVDSISFVTKTDGEAPTLTYTGSSTVYWAEGVAFTLNATAWDDVQGVIDVEYIWSDSAATNADGTLNQGEYTLTLRARDFSGNSSQVMLNVIVGEKETEAPVIEIPTTQMRLTTGTIPMLIPTVTDNSGIVSVSTAWSSGALDAKGRLTTGTHTYTITAVDPSQNTVQKTVTVYVTENENYAGSVLDESTTTNPVYVYYPGEGTGSPIVDYAAAGTQITLADCAFESPVNKRFKAWAIGGVNGTQKSVGERITISANTFIYAVWEDITYEVSFNGNGGSGTMNGETLVVGSTYTLPANAFTAPSNKYFKCWSVNGVEKAVGTVITVNADTTVTAVWEDITYTVTFNGNGGSGTMNGETLVVGSTYTLPANAFTAPSNKYFKCWSVDGVEKAVGTVITVNANTTVTAVWEDITYTVTFNGNGGGGTMNGETLVVGSTYTLPANAFTAPSNKYFKCWSVNGVEKAVGTVITVNADTTVTAVWEDVPVTVYTIMASAGENGSISPGGAVTVEEGESQTFTITASVGYHIMDVEVNGVSVGAVVTYTFENVSANASISVEFEQDVVAHECAPQVVNEKPSDCTESGKRAYYRCQCGKNYEDASATREIENIDEWGIIPALGHEWINADCDTPKTCDRCGETQGNALGHEWINATCNAPKTCDRCGETQGNALSHVWGAATCDTPKTCLRGCGATQGEALGHDESGAWVTDSENHWKVCATCQETIQVGAHADEDEDGVCDVCATALGNTPDTNVPGGGNNGGEQPDTPDTPDVPGGGNNGGEAPDTPDEDEDLGCNGSIGGTLISVTLAVAACVLVKKKRKED